MILSKQWKLETVVWDEHDWERIPEQIRELLLELKREIGKTTATRFLVSIARRG
jgi:hypothetical protein